MSPIVSDGLSLMAFGMGTVFVFLVTLILVTSIMSSLIERFLPEPASKPANIEQTTSNVDPRLLKVIALAVKEHKSRQ